MERFFGSIVTFSFSTRRSPLASPNHAIDDFGEAVVPLVDGLAEPPTA